MAVLALATVPLTAGYLVAYPGRAPAPERGPDGPVAGGLLGATLAALLGWLAPTAA